jgi:hypothetical protein
MVVIQAVSQCHESEIYADNSGNLKVTIIAAVQRPYLAKHVAYLNLSAYHDTALASREPI